MALCCDNSVRDHEMGYHQGGGTAYITAKGVTRRTGLSRAAAERALQRLEAAGVSEPGSDGAAWRTGAARALQLYRDLDDRSGEAEALNNIAGMIRGQRDRAS